MRVVILDELMRGRIDGRDSDASTLIAEQPPVIGLAVRHGRRDVHAVVIVDGQQTAIEGLVMEGVEQQTVGCVRLLEAWTPSTA